MQSFKNGCTINPDIDRQEVKGGDETSCLGACWQSGSSNSFTMAAVGPREVKIIDHFLVSCRITELCWTENQTSPRIRSLVWDVWINQWTQGSSCWTDKMKVKGPDREPWSLPVNEIINLTQIIDEDLLTVVQSDHLVHQVFTWQQRHALRERFTAPFNLHHVWWHHLPQALNTPEWYFCVSMRKDLVEVKISSTYTWCSLGIHPETTPLHHLHPPAWCHSMSFWIYSFTVMQTIHKFTLLQMHLHLLTCGSPMNTLV